MPNRWVPRPFCLSEFALPLQSPHMSYVGHVPTPTTGKNSLARRFQRNDAGPFFGYVYPPTVCAQTPVRLGATCEWMAPCQLSSCHPHSLLVSLACPPPLLSVFFLRFFYSHPPLLLFSALPLITPQPPQHTYTYTHPPLLCVL